MFRDFGLGELFKTFQDSRTTISPYCRFKVKGLNATVLNHIYETIQMESHLV